MKKILILLILFMVLPTVVMANKESSYWTNGYTFTGNGSSYTKHWMQYGKGYGLRVTFVDADGAAVNIEGWNRSYDYMTFQEEYTSLVYYYNAFAGDKNKITMSKNANFSTGEKGVSEFVGFGKLAEAYNKYLAKDDGPSPNTYNHPFHDSDGNNVGEYRTGGRNTNGWDKETQWLKNLTAFTNDHYIEDVEAFVKAFAEVNGLDANKMLNKMAECGSAGNEVFIVVEPMFAYTYYPGSGKWINFLGTLSDVYYFDGGRTGQKIYEPNTLVNNTVLTTHANVMKHINPIEAFKGAAAVDASSTYSIQNATQLLNATGYTMGINWANDPSAYNCGTCAFYPIDTVEEEQFATVIGDKKDWALVANNKLYSKVIFNDPSGNPTELFPSIFPTIAHFAFASEEDQGANCCETFTPEDFTEMKNRGFWDEAEVTDWQQVYDDTCYESCDIYKIVDDSGAKHYGLFYDRNVYGPDSLASLSLPARYKEIQVYPSRFEHISEFAYAYEIEEGAGCCNDLTADEIQLAVDAGYMSTAEAYKWQQSYEEMCDPSCKFYYSEEDNDWGILHNYEVYSNSLGGPAGFGSLAEFAYTEAPDGAGCCSSINITQIFEKYKDGLLSESEFNEWYAAYYEKCDDPPDCCMMAPFIVPGHIEGDVNNCCEETHSEAKEYELDDLFCYDINLKVNHYDPKCDVEYYLDDKANLNDYCEMYCTERVTVDTPEPITAINGRYFTMKVNPVGNTTSVYIEGFKRCRMRIFYDKWEQDYYDTVEDERTIYNEIQRQRAIEKMYLDSEDQATVSGTIEASASCYCKTRSGTTQSGRTTYSYSYANGDDELDYSYVPYYFPNQEQDYYTIKINPAPRNTETTVFEKIELLYDQTLTEEHEKYSIQNWETLRANAENTKVTAMNECLANLSCPGGTKHKSSSTRTKMPHESEDVRDEYVPTALANVQGVISNLTANYNGTARTAKELEKQIDVCTDYFTEHDGFLYPEQHYDFQATQEFYYYQVYLDDMGELKEDYIYVDWKDEPGCVVTGPFVGAADDGDEEINEPQYSGIYDEGVQQMIDMAESGTIELQTSTNGFKQYLDEKYEAKKQFTHDAKYKVVCEWEEEENQLFTLVPNGFSATEATTTNFTVHERQYRVFLTTLEGQYETFWDVKGLGEMQADGTGKFDKFFEENGVTCAEEPAKDATLFTCKLEVNHSLVITGICNGTNGSDTNHDIDDCDPYKEMYRLFTFKIVDPANLFPTNPDYDIEADSAEYAYNWLVDEEGRAALDVIEARGQEDLTYAIDNLTYSFTLTPEDMRHIKNYNETREINGGYSDFELDCVCPEVANPNDGCIQCKSTFIANLANGRISYSGRSYDMTGWANERETLGQVRDGNNW